MNAAAVDLPAALNAALAAHHLENLRLYGEKARQCRAAGREDLAVLFRTYALHAGRQWLTAIGSGVQLGHAASGRTATAREHIAAARAACVPVVTNLSGV